VAVSAGFLAYAVELFAPWAPVTTKRMFGGGGILRDGRMFGLMADDQIYLKVNDQTRAAFEAVGAVQFVFETKAGGRMAMSYWSLPSEALDDSDTLIEWADRAWAAAAKAKSSAKLARARGLTKRELAELPLKPLGKPTVSIKKR
jgi:DNA transformation protein and related proteins